MEHSKLVKELIESIRERYSPTEKVKVSKDGTQTIFFRKASKPLCYIETKETGSRAVIVIGNSLKEKVYEADLRPRVKDMFDNAKEFYDGRWLVFDINSKEDVSDVLQLLSVKRKPSK
jgi:hypothetical protein